MEKRDAKMLFNKSGGSSTGTTNRVTIPTKWVKQMGISEDDRDLTLTFEKEKIIIEKKKE